MNHKPLFMQTEDELISNAAHTLKNIHVCSVLKDIDKIQFELKDLLKADVINDYHESMVTALFRAEIYFGLPVWWDSERVSVNGCHVEFSKHNGNQPKARILASIMAISVYNSIVD